MDKENELLCGDCGIDCNTSSKYYYMVLDSVWAEGQRHGAVDLLCPHCLERRLGRTLVKADFSKAFINQLYFAACESN